MRKFSQQKIWRDKAIARLEVCGSCVHSRGLDDQEYDAQLRLKFREETDEVCVSQSKKELIEELADVLEVIDSLCLLHNISREEVVAVQDKKRADRGGFANRIFVDYVEHPKGSFGESYCLASPEKYPEIL